MKRLIITIAAVLSACCTIFAQDKITKKDGTTIEAVVTEVSDTEVKYKMYSRQDGPTYTLSTTEIDNIIYPNGDQDVFTTEEVYSEDGATITRGMKYNEYKQYYDTKYYVKNFDDPHSPGWCCVGSLLIPGLGQACCGQWGRAAMFFGGALLTSLGENACTTITYDSNSYSSSVSYSSGYYIFWVANLAIDIWAAVDACKMAKIIDMYYQDTKNLADIHVSLRPDLAAVPTSSGITAAPGFKLAVEF